MRTVAFLLDPDPGHVFPAVALGEVLARHRFDVHFFGIADLEALVPEQFQFHCTFGDIYPKGFLMHYKEQQKDNSSAIRRGDVIFRPHFSSIIGGHLDDVIAGVSPDVFVITYSLSMEAMFFRAKYPELPFAIVTTWLRPGYLSPAKQVIDALKTLLPEEKKKLIGLLPGQDINKGIVELNRIPELIACPAELEFPDRPLVMNATYIGGGIRSAARQERSRFQYLSEHRKIVYLNLGSQTQLFIDEARLVMVAVYNYFLRSDGNEWCLIMALGDVDLELQSVEGKIEIMKWAPQLDILAVASVMITHGGLGTIRECIANEVPMIVIPMIYDQFENAGRVVVHGLGKKILREELSAATIDAALRDVVGDSQVKSNLARMSANFQNQDHLIVQAFEKLINHTAVIERS